MSLSMILNPFMKIWEIWPGDSYNLYSYKKMCRPQNVSGENTTLENPKQSFFSFLHGQILGFPRRSA